MPSSRPAIEVFLEIGQKKVFAGVFRWPGWYGSGRDEASALQALHEAGPRYQRALLGARLGFKAPADPTMFRVVERVPGNSTTDFGAPNVPLARDAVPVAPDELRRLRTLLNACWAAFDDAAEAARGRPLSKGPRGGGRELDGIVAHVRAAEEGYLVTLGWKVIHDKSASPLEAQAQTRAAIQKALGAAVRGELPSSGPRGGKRWQPRTFVRRAAWHLLDHVGEIEKRLG
ncbi:MAG: hypothetical protein IT318_03950 [Anaerolineales bacterium]|nr:hypothetical protein [Anaerolineales bacterium]